MSQALSAARPDNPTQFLLLASAVHEWEPELEVEYLPTQGRLYDPDRTLYAVCLSDETTVSTDRRQQLISRGELIVLPESRAIETTPDCDFLAVRSSGPPPYHFRERFIQVWAFDHLTSAPQTTAAGLLEALAAVESQHRIGFAHFELGREAIALPARGLDRFLLVSLEGVTTVESDGLQPSVELPPGTIALTTPGQGLRAAGPSRLAVLSLSTEGVHQARLLATRRAAARLTPEYPGPS